MEISQTSYKVSAFKPMTSNPLLAKKMEEASQVGLISESKPSSSEVLSDRKRGMSSSLYSSKANLVVDAVEPLLKNLKA